MRYARFAMGRTTARTNTTTRSSAEVRTVRSTLLRRNATSKRSARAIRNGSHTSELRFPKRSNTSFDQSFSPLLVWAWCRSCGGQIHGTRTGDQMVIDAGIAASSWSAGRCTPPAPTLDGGRIPAPKQPGRHPVVSNPLTGRRGETAGAHAASAFLLYTPAQFSVGRDHQARSTLRAPDQFDDQVVAAAGSLLDPHTRYRGNTPSMTLDD